MWRRCAWPTLRVGPTLRRGGQPLMRIPRGGGGGGGRRGGGGGGRRRRRSTRVRERSNSEGDMEGIPIATGEPVACGHEIATRSPWPVRVPPSPQGREGGGGGSRDEGG